MFLPTIDLETYSEAGYNYDVELGRFLPLNKSKPGLLSVGAAVYAEHPSTEILSLCVDLLDGCGVRLWKSGDAAPVALLNYVGGDGLLEAHNSMFEYLLWHHICHERQGWPDIALGRFRCSMSKAMAWGLPGALGKLSDILDVETKKKKSGKSLIQLLSVPQVPTKANPSTRKTIDTHPGLYYDMYDYNHFDVLAEQQVSNKLPDLTPTEEKVWLLDQEINNRGVHIDVDSLDACIKLFEESQVRAVAELSEVTGGAVNTIGEIAKLKSGDVWAQSRGVTLASFDKAGVSAALETDLPPDVRRMLEIKEVAGGAAVKKIYAMRNCLTRDNRVKGTTKYCGALRTGRWAGRILQTQNMKSGGPDWTVCQACGGTCAYAGPRSCPACGCAISEPEVHEWSNAATEKALHDMRTSTLDTVEKTWGPLSALIGACTRGLLTASEGHDLICSDFSAIEAVVLAALAGEEWRLEVFRTHGKIYEASASKISGIPLEEILDHKVRTGKHHELRKKIGKPAELGSGYGGWIGAWKNFGADKFMTDDEIKAGVLAWRKESPAIVEMWGGQWRKDPDRWDWTPELYGVEGCFIYATLNPGVVVPYRLISFFYDAPQDVLYITLPSGRKMPFHSPRLYRGPNRLGMDAWTIYVKGANPKTGRWVDEETYGGKLVENICQATARDIMAATMLRLDSYGYKIVLHVHDEAAAEVPEGLGSVEHFEQVMMMREPWYADWPIKAAGGWRGKRFRK